MKTFSYLLLMLMVPTFILTGCSDDDGNGNENKQIEIPNKSEQTQTAFADDVTTGGFTFTAKSTWEATVTETTNTKRSTTKASSVNWIRLLYNGVETHSGSAGTFSLTIEIDTNYSGTERCAEIKVISGNDYITVTVTQKGAKEDGTKPVPTPSVEELVALCEQSYDQVCEAWLKIDNDYSTYTSRLSLTQASPFLFDFWQKSYEWIAHSNLLIEQLDNSNLPESSKASYRGKALAGRATAYFYLKTLFGGVPLAANQETPVNSIPRNTAKEVIDFIYDDIDRVHDLSIKPFTAFYGLVREIVFMQEDDGANHVISTLREKIDRGDIIFRDTNRDGIINTQDENTEALLAFLLLAEAYLKTDRNRAADCINNINTAYAQEVILSSDDILTIIRTKYSVLLPNAGMKFLNAVRWEDTQSWGYRALLPIPSQAMLENPNLTQNEGW